MSMTISKHVVQFNDQYLFVACLQHNVCVISYPVVQHTGTVMCSKMDNFEMYIYHEYTKSKQNR